MAVANAEGGLLLATGNKSELAVGYCTLYGDMNGGLAVIGDVYKCRVFELCAWLDSPAAASCRADLGLPASGELVGAAIRHKPPAPSCGPTSRTATPCRSTPCSIPCWRPWWSSAAAPNSWGLRATTVPWPSG